MNQRASYQCRLRWDALVGNWANCKRPQGATQIVLPPPTDWKFDLELLNLLDGRIAVEATFVAVEFRPHPGWLAGRDRLSGQDRHLVGL